MTSGLSGLKELRVFVKKAVATRELARAGLGLGRGIKEQEGLRVFQVVVSRDQKTF